MFPEVPFDKYTGLMILLRFESRREGHGALRRARQDFPGYY